MKILLVEDSRVLRGLLHKIIGSIPDAAVVAETDNEGDARCYLEKFQPNVVVLDLHLRVGNGLSVLEHIRAVYPATKTIVLTNYGQPEYRAKCMALGADHFFDKVKDFGTFEHLLTDLARIEAGMASSVASDLAS